MKYDANKLLEIIISDPDVCEWSTREILSFLIGFCAEDNKALADLFSEIRSRDIR